MSFSSRRRNYLLTPHRRDGLTEWMKSMLMHSFVLDALATTAADTFSHFEMLVDEHRNSKGDVKSRLKQLVPTVGIFHTRLPLREAFEIYDEKYALTKRRHICISFNELRQILNLAQILALRNGEERDADNSGTVDGRNLLLTSNKEEDSSKSPSSDDFIIEAYNAANDIPFRFNGPKMITFDGDQTLYSDGANFESNPKLANYLYLLLRCGVTIAVVTAAGYGYQSEKYELRLSGLLAYFKQMDLPPKDCERFYIFGGECNYLLSLGDDYKLHPVKETGAGGWLTSTEFIKDSPANWVETDVQSLLDKAEESIKDSLQELNIPGRIIRKKRAIGLIPKQDEAIRREALDETVLRAQSCLRTANSANLPYCAFNGGRDVWVDVGNKGVGVHILSAYLGVPLQETLHIGDQFLSTGNDVAARGICPCIWITSPEETTYILKSILRLASVPLNDGLGEMLSSTLGSNSENEGANGKEIDVNTMFRRHSENQQQMDVYTGEIMNINPPIS